MSSLNRSASASLDSSASQIVRKTFDFSVDKFPLFGPDNMPTDQYGLFRSDTGYINKVKSISKIYVPHTTDDVCALVEAAEKAFDREMKVECHWNRGHYVKLRVVDSERLSIFGEKDNIFPQMMIRGGFDGSGFKATIGWFRDLCRNLSMMRKVEATEQSIAHRSNLRSDMDHLIDTFSQLKAGWTNLKEVALQMENTNVNFSEFIHEVYADKMPTAEQILLSEQAKVRAVTNFENRIKRIMKRHTQESSRSGRSRSAGNMVTGWQAYNAVQGYEQWKSAYSVSQKPSWEFTGILNAEKSKHVAKAAEMALAG